MNFRTLMQAGPAKANELFTRLSDTSDGAVKTREKLFSELKTELELHTSLEEQHLFPILRRNAETKGIVADAIRDNKELRAKLAELDGLPKNDATFAERLKALQKTFRQHARDEKRELLPAVQRALSEEKIQVVAEKIEAGVADAEQVKHDELEERRAKARHEREQAEQKEAAELAEKQAAAQARKAEQEEAARRAADVIEPFREVARAATSAAQTNVHQFTETAMANVERLGAEVSATAGTYIDAVEKAKPDVRSMAAVPNLMAEVMTGTRSFWMEWMNQTTQAGTQMSQQLMKQAAEQQQRFITDTLQGWMERNTRAMQLTMRMAEEGFRPFATGFERLSQKRS